MLKSNNSNIDHTGLETTQNLTQEKKNHFFISEEFKAKLRAEKNSYVVARSATLQPGIVEKICQDITEQFKLENVDAAVSVLALLFQQGGTARSCDGNMTVTLWGHSVKLADIRKIMKQNSCNKAERKLARSLATTIHEIAAIMEIPGNLYLKIQKKT